VTELPVSFIEEYSRERRFGLSDQSRRGWLGDYAKGATISTALSALLATLFGFALRRAPRRWPILASIGVFPLFIIGNLIVPLYVMPLFNKFEPVTGSLEERLRALASRYGVGEAAILRMDMSRQTRKANGVAGVDGLRRLAATATHGQQDRNEGRANQPPEPLDLDRRTFHSALLSPPAPPTAAPFCRASVIRGNR